jgi:hypothetical protein
MRYALSLTAAAILALSLLACGGGEDGDGADGGPDGSEPILCGEDDGSRDWQLCYCEALDSLDEGATPAAQCCSFDAFTGEASRPCIGDGFHVVVSGADPDDELCIYRDADSTPHPDGDYFQCGAALCEPCE